MTEDPGDDKVAEQSTTPSETEKGVQPSAAPSPTSRMGRSSCFSTLWPCVACRGRFQRWHGRAASPYHNVFLLRPVATLSKFVLFAVDRIKILFKKKEI